jgi:hypothetical protein
VNANETLGPIQRLIERSSFGTPAARRHRARTPDAIAARILARVDPPPLRVAVHEDDRELQRLLAINFELAWELDRDVRLVALAATLPGLLAAGRDQPPEVVVAHWRRSYHGPGTRPGRLSPDDQLRWFARIQRAWPAARLVVSGVAAADGARLLQAGGIRVAGVLESPWSPEGLFQLVRGLGQGR